MFQIQIDRTNALIDFVVDGYIPMTEMQRFVEELKKATESLKGREIVIKADMRTFKPASPEAAVMLRDVQEFGLRNGVKRVAELVESQIVALQLNRVARESGTDKILRRFWEEAEARRWLLHGDPEDASPRR